MSGWYHFWIANFVLAGSAFLVIALIVLVRGIADLRQMFKSLSQDAQRKESKRLSE
jgi:hypothetical protein